MAKANSKATVEEATSEVNTSVLGSLTPEIAPKVKKSILPHCDVRNADDFTTALQNLENALGMPVWCLIQGPRCQMRGLYDDVRDHFFSARVESNPWYLERGKPVGVVVDSYGGLASSAYHIARFLQNHCGGFTAIVPRRAKSAATLLSIGAQEIILGEYGELGPLDVQVADDNREETISGLDETQQLERLHNFAVTAFDQTLQVMLHTTGMKSAKVFPHAIKFVTDLVQPMFAHVDVVRYTQMSRALRVAEEYARRLLLKNYDQQTANYIASQLVVAYPEHGFIIDHEEAKRLRIKVRDVDSALRNTINALTVTMTDSDSVFGRLV